MLSELLTPVPATNRSIHQSFSDGTSPRQWKDLEALVDQELKEVSWQQCQS